MKTLDAQKRLAKSTAKKRIRALAFIREILPFDLAHIRTAIDDLEAVEEKSPLLEAQLDGLRRQEAVVVALQPLIPTKNSKSSR